MSRLYVGDIGASIIIYTLNVGIPITAVITLHLEKPSGTTIAIDITAEMINYTTGVIIYPTVEDDLDEAGEYRGQLHGVFDDGTDEMSEIDTFTVYEKIEVEEV